MKTTVALCAAQIRKELKAAYPETKFSITSKSYTGGSSVDIDYEDGPTEKELQKITGKHEYGHFNGMEDIYEYSNVNGEIHQAKFVFIHRDPSEKTKNEIMQRLGLTGGYNDYNPETRRYNYEVVRGEFREPSHILKVA